MCVFYLAPALKDGSALVPLLKDVLHFIKGVLTSRLDGIITYT